MFKWIGILLVCVGTMGCSYCIVEERKNAIREYVLWHRILEVMEGEVVFQKSSLPEICQRINRLHILKENKLILFTEVEKWAAQKSGETFGEVWKNGMQKELKQSTMNQEIVQALMSLGDKLCFEEAAMQQKIICSMQTQIEKQMNTEKQENQNRNKLTMCMGTMIGILVVIILL